MPDREKVINGLESLRDICNARSNLFVGDSRIIWAGYGKLASDAIDIIESQERIYLALEKDWKELRNQQEADAEIEGGGRDWWYVCGECRAVIDSNDSYCSKCGRRIRWKRLGGNE
mgnify:CR=1 FL=1